MGPDDKLTYRDETPQIINEIPCTAYGHREKGFECPYCYNTGVIAIWSDTRQIYNDKKLAVIAQVTDVQFSPPSIGYAPTPPVTTGVCSACGAIVDNMMDAQTKHKDFHRKLDELAAMSAVLKEIL
jgi:hypothetical protein